MHSELEKKEFGKVIPLFADYPQDPMLFSALEGHQAGRVFVDNTDRPTTALVWTGMEYAYFASKNADPTAAWQPFTGIVEKTILPAVEEAGFGFISVFVYTEELRQELLQTFNARKPTSYGVNIYTFHQVKFEKVISSLLPLPGGYTLKPFDTELLSKTEMANILEDIQFCWESTDIFLQLGLGTCILHEGKPVSSCYAIGYGADAYHITVWTLCDHRMKGLAKHAAAAVIQAAIQKGKTIYWLNDAPNIASRKLAESLGFAYAGDLFPVDIPSNPGPFHIGLGDHFYHPLKDYSEAGNLYETGFSLGAGEAKDHIQAAKAWTLANQQEKAFANLRRAVEMGWKDVKVLETDDAFDTLKDKEEWKKIIGLIE